jgi:hypothetical protein
MTLQTVTTTGPDRTTRHPERTLLLWLFVLMAAVLSLIQEGVIVGYDGQTMYAVTESIVERGTVAISDEWNTLPGRGGLQYSRYGPGLSLLSIAPYLLVRPVAMLSGHQAEVLAAAVSLLMPLIGAALVVALYLLARRLGARAGAALLVGAGGVLGTFALPYTKEFFSEPLAALCLVVAIERLLAARPAAAGLAMAAAVLTRPQTLLLAPILLFVAWRQRGVAGLLRACAGLAPGLVATLAYNLVRYGDPLTFGYQDVGFTTPLLKGAGGLLFNPLKSLFLFAPVTLLLPFALRDLWRRNRLAFLLIAGNLAVTFVTAALWFAWHGGWSWGPRLLLPGLAPAIAAIGPWISSRSRQRVAALLLAAGLLVSSPAVIVSTQAQQLEVPPVPPETHFLDTQPLSSPSVVGQFALIPSRVRYSVEHLYEDHPGGTEHLRSLSLWQLGMARVMGRAGLALGVAGTVLLLLLVAFALQRLRGAVLQLPGPAPVAAGAGMAVPGGVHVERP